jgi:hypothetical protein
VSSAAFLKTIGGRMTCQLTKKDVKELRWYRYSSTRICILMRDTLLPVTWWTNDEYVQGYIKELGIKEMKKPKPPRRSYAYYD